MMEFTEESFPELTPEEYRVALEERVKSEISPVTTSEIRDLLPLEERVRRRAEVERLERALQASSEFASR